MSTVERIRDYSKEYIEEGGPTSEFSTTMENWEEKVKAFQEGTGLIRHAFPWKGECRWVVYECETCLKHSDGEFNLHAAIESTDFWPAGHVPEGCVVVYDALA